jgi:hypothetical protein
MPGMRDGPDKGLMVRQGNYSNLIPTAFNMMMRKLRTDAMHGAPHTKLQPAGNQEIYGKEMRMTYSG